MWSPIGYRSLYETRDYLRQLAFRSLGTDPELRTQSLEDDIGILSNYSLRGFALSAWSFNNLVEDNISKNSFFALCPSGQIMKVSSVIVDQDRVYDGPFPENREKQVSMLQQLHDRFIHLNADTLIVEADRKSDLIETLDLWQQATALKPLDGAIVCIPWVEECQIESLDEYLSTEDMAPPRVGRPQKVTALTIVIEKLFPHGVSDTPLKEVAAKIRGSRLYSQEFSDTTLLRALGKRP